MDTIWVNAEEAFINDFKEWHQENEERQHILRMGKRLLPNVSEGRHSPLIKKQGMKYMIKLDEIETNKVDKRGNSKKVPTFKLSGNLIQYVRSIEKQNMELQLQLDAAMDSLKEADICHQQTLLDQISLNESLQQQLLDSIKVYKKAENDRCLEVASLENDIDCLRGKLSEMLEQQDELEKTRKEKKKIYDGDSGLLEVQVERIKYLEKKNSKLIAENKELLSCKIKNEKSLRDLWERNEELHRKLAHSREKETLIEEQNREIMELRAQLDTAIESCETMKVHMDMLDPNGVQLSLDSLTMVDSSDDDIKENKIHRARKEKDKSLGSMNRIDEPMANSTDPNDLKVFSKSRRLSLAMVKSDGTIFEWTPWIIKTANYAISRDLEGIKAELADLQLHREQAFKRAKEQTAQTLYLWKDYIPFVKSIL